MGVQFNPAHLFPVPDLEPVLEAAATAAGLARRLRDARAEEVLAHAARDAFPGRLAVVSSFGTESAVLLHLLSRVAPDVPVLFLDTGRLFGETRQYRRDLAALLGLRDVRDITPDPGDLAAEDREQMLFQTDPDRCCYLRKVAPLATALDGFDAWITGRKAFQGGARRGLPLIEADGTRIKINPLANWTASEIDAYFESHGLPRHPLYADGFLSIGCMPCTDRVRPGEDPRAGRWRGRDKTECGIHQRGAGQ